MNKLVFLIPAVVSLVFTGAIQAQEATPTPSATPSPSPAATPDATPAATPAASPAGTAKTAPAATPVTGIDKPPSLSLTPDTPSSDSDLLPPIPSDPGAATEPLPPPDDTLPPAEGPGTADLPDPDTLLPPPDASESAPPPPPTIAENKFKEDRDLKVRYQEVKLQALKDVRVRSLREQADAAKTDEAKRQALREYYRLLFAKMVSIDVNLQAKCDLMEKAYLRRLGQYRVEPTIPLNPPPVPEPLEVAGASPTPKPRR